MIGMGWVVDFSRRKKKKKEKKNGDGSGRGTAPFILPELAIMAAMVTTCQ